MQKEVRNVAGLNGKDQGIGRIVIRLSTPLQLFNTLDPSPGRLPLSGRRRRVTGRDRASE
jgi:hypothetical protein